MKLNLPNKLTVLRIILIPIFVALMMTDNFVCQLFAALAFALASLTDMADGYVARKLHQETDFGKLMDPMADKLIVMAALIGLVAQGRAPWLATMIVLGREFVISAFRLVAVDKGKVIAAGMIGKIKTASQMIAIMLLLLGGMNDFFLVSGELLLWLSVVLSTWSLFEYIYKNRGILK